MSPGIIFFLPLCFHDATNNAVFGVQFAHPGFMLINHIHVATVSGIISHKERKAYKCHKEFSENPSLSLCLRCLVL